MNQIWNRSRGDKLFDWMNNLFFVVVSLVILYPLYFMVISSFSDPDAVNSGLTFFLPQEITFEGYKRIFTDPRIMLGYKNSLIYTLAAMIVKTAMTITAGYVLSRKDLVGRNFFMMIIIFTMFFQGGLIPTYLLVKDLGMLNTMWALIIPGAVSVYLLIIVRTFFQQTIPDELFEAASIDGCSNIKFFTGIVLPLSMPIIAVIALFSAVQEWNGYFQALIYLRDQKLFPLQMILRDILIQNEAQDSMLEVSMEALQRQKAAEQIKYGVIIVASVPMLILYPFLQKYFVKGVMIGSVKG
ncbi:carbohydrate ABC transporter permease [Paenibacillus sp. GD4]|uniref:carbohydrate ABC transporter permease n=1 Tax=Paenibacillus TaxID=44249 RepID=UPI002543A783|nr:MULTISPECIES: carbohydrate ABC transporter permease [Paenibacillus]MDQ1914775.1 carbohydrate ABC transporter permease [Paenibacillus sp. GD4]